MRRRARTLVAITLFLTGCGPSTGAATPIAPSAVAASPSPEAPAVAQLALADAAAHLGVSTQQLNVAQVEARDWPDSSLGCPRPGLMYSQIVTPGYLIIISGAGRRLEYHTDTQARMVLCSES